MSYPLGWKPPLGRDTVEWVLSSFDPEKANVAFVPLTSEDSWDTLGRIATAEGARAILGILPGLTQIQQRMYTNMPEGILAAFLPPEQLSALPLFAQHLSLDGIVVSKNLAHEVLEALSGVGKLPYLQILYGIESTIEKIPYPRVYKEVHVVPGIVGLYQCKPLATNQTTNFHLSSAFDWRGVEGKTYVTDPRGRFCDVEFAQRFERTLRPCPCGEKAHVTIL